MIKTVCNEVRISGIDIAHKYRDKEHLISYLSTKMSRDIAHYLLEEKMVYIKQNYDPSYDENIYRTTLYVATEDDYIAQERGTKPFDLYSKEAAILEQEGYKRGVRVALASVAAKADKMSKDRLKKNQHAAVVLIEAATEVEEELI